MLKTLIAFVAGGVIVGGVLIARDFMEEVPPSELASPDSTAALALQMERLRPHLVTFATAEVAEQRALLDEHFYSPRSIAPANATPSRRPSSRSRGSTPRYSNPKAACLKRTRGEY